MEVKEGKQEVVPDISGTMTKIPAKIWFESKMANFKKYLADNLPKNSAIRAEFEKVGGLPTEVLITGFGPELMKYKNGNLDILLDIIAERTNENLKKYKPEVLETIKKYLRLIIDFIAEI